VRRPTVEVSLIRTGTAALPPRYVFRSEPGGAAQALGWRVPAHRYIRVPLGALLVEHPHEGALLVDCGMHPVVATDPARNLGRLGAAVMPPCAATSEGTSRGRTACA
jgi:hypothetical protein